MTAKKPKLTKKMLLHLDQAEARVLLMTAVQADNSEETVFPVAPELAYQNDLKWCVNKIYDNQSVFATCDLSGVREEKFRNLAVYNYVKQLQGYLSGQNEAPNWPPEEVAMVGSLDGVADLVERSLATEEEIQFSDGTIVKDVVTEPRTPVGRPMKKVKPKKVTRLVPPSQSSPEAEPEDGKDLIDFTSEMKNFLDKEKGSEKVVTKIAFKKVGFAPVSDTSPASLSDTDTEYFDESFAELKGRMDLIENALLFILNSAIVKDDVINSLEEIPSPPYE